MACRGVGAVLGVSLRVGAGQVVTVIGPNGAGKTSLLHAVMGLVPGQGAMRLGGRDMTRLPVEARVRAGCRWCPSSGSCSPA